MNKPCLKCGILTPESYCNEHAPKRIDTRTGRDRSTLGRGQGWQNLSPRARKMQPYCKDCGATEDLTADHMPSAWHRILAFFGSSFDAGIFVEPPMLARYIIWPSGSRRPWMRRRLASRRMDTLIPDGVCVPTMRWSADWQLGHTSSPGRTVVPHWAQWTIMRFPELDWNERSKNTIGCGLGASLYIAPYLRLGMSPAIAESP
jgi:hypothetical protein